MSITLTIPLGQVAECPCDSTPTAYTVDTQHIVRFGHPRANILHIRPINLGTVTIKAPSWGHGQDCVVTAVAANGTPAASGIAATFLTGYSVGTGYISATVGEVPSARPAVPAGTSGGSTPHYSGKPN